MYLYQLVKWLALFCMCVSPLCSVVNWYGFDILLKCTEGSSDNSIVPMWNVSLVGTGTVLTWCLSTLQKVLSQCSVTWPLQAVDGRYVSKHVLSTETGINVCYNNTGGRLKQICLSGRKSINQSILFLMCSKQQTASPTRWNDHKGRNS